MKTIITEELWLVIQNCIPKKSTKRGRPHSDYRKVFDGIVYVLKNGICWHNMPSEFGKPSTIHGVFMQLTRAGVFNKIYEAIRTTYQEKTSENNWYAIDSSSKKAPFANFSGNNPTDRKKKGIKQAIIVDRSGIPVELFLTSANVHDSQILKPMLQDWQAQERVRILTGDAAFDAEDLRSFSKEKNIALITVHNPRGKKNDQKTKVPYRWVVERTIGWLSWYRGLKICWAKLLESHMSFLQLACSIQIIKSL
jgi:putative transposase